MLSRFMKWVGMPSSFSRVKINSEMRLLSTPLPSMTAFFWRVEGGGVVLVVDDDRAGLRTFVEDLGLAFVDAGRSWCSSSISSSKPLIPPSA